MSKRILYFLLFPFFWAITLVVYYRARGAQFVYDHNMWMVQYEKMGWSGMKVEFGEKAIHYFFQYAYFFFYECFGWKSLYWTLLQTAWHGLNAVLLFAVISKWAQWYHLNRPRWIGFVAALFFLLSPYHTEAVIWGAGVEYMMVTTFVLCAIWSLSSYFESERVLYLWGTYLFYLLALITWELGLVIPFMAIFLFMASPYDKVGLKRSVASLFVPMTLLVPVYFMIAKLMSGSALSHYGAAVHLNFSPQLIVSNVTRFVLKLTDLSLVFSKLHTYAFVCWLKTPSLLAVQIALYFFILIFFILSLVRRRNLFLVLVMGMYLISLLPMLNLYFAYFTYIESDRYVYLCSGFFYGGLAAWIFSLRVEFRCLLIAAFLFIQVFFLHRFVTAWCISGRVVHGLVESFRWQSARHIYILATPDAVNGAWCLRSLPPYGIAIALKAQRGIDIMDRMDEVVQYEMYSMKDSCHADKVSDGVYHYAFTQYGNWFIRGGLGAENWEDDKYKVEIDEWGMSFVVRLKNYKPGDVVIYQVKDHWEEIK